MSKQALDAFRAKLAADENLRNEMTRALSQDGQKSTATVADMAAFAKSRGYDLSAEDVGSVMALSDDELDKVSGGILDSSSYSIKLDGSFSINSFSFNFAKI